MIDLVLLAKGSSKYRYFPPYKDTVQNIFLWVIITMHSFEFAWMILGAKGGGLSFFCCVIRRQLYHAHRFFFVLMQTCMQTSLHRFLAWYAFTEMQQIRCDSHWLSVLALADFLQVPYGLLHTVHTAAFIVPYPYIHMAPLFVALPRSALHTTYHGRRGRLGWLPVSCLLSIFNQCSESVAFCYLWLTDPDEDLDPALFVSDLQDAYKILLFFYLVFMLIPLWRYIYILLQKLKFMKK
jgi:hypothetical protein